MVVEKVFMIASVIPVIGNKTGSMYVCTCMHICAYARVHVCMQLYMDKFKWCSSPTKPTNNPWQNGLIQQYLVFMLSKLQINFWNRDIRLVISSNVTKLKTFFSNHLENDCIFLKLVLRQVWKKTELQDASKNRTRSVYCTNTVDCSISARVGMCFWCFDSMLQNTILLEIWALRLSGLNPWQNGLNQQHLVFMLSNLQINYWNRDIRLVISSNVTKLKTFFSNHLKNDCIFLKLVLLQVWENRGTRH